MILEDPRYLCLDGLTEDAVGRNWRTVGEILKPKIKEMIVVAALRGIVSPERAFSEINELGLRHA